MGGGGARLLLAACVLAACAAIAHGAAALQLGVINSASGGLTDWNDTLKGERMRHHAWQRDAEHFELLHAAHVS